MYTLGHGTDKLMKDKVMDFITGSGDLMLGRGYLSHYSEYALSSFCHYTSH